MQRLCLLCLLFGMVSSSAFASPDEARTHNEYHNSTIYNGTQEMPRTRDPRDFEEGIRVYRDPDTGDRVISVRSRLYQNNTNTQQPPVYVDPHVYVPY